MTTELAGKTALITDAGGVGRALAFGQAGRPAPCSIWVV
jgi:hypothetical protein